MTDVKSLLKKAELFERLAVYGGRRAFLNALGQDSIYVDPIESLDDPYDVPAPKKQYKPLADGAPINPEIQKALIRVFPEAQGWVKVDGVMGPNTRGALNKYKQKFNDSRDISDPGFQQDLIRKKYLPSL